MKLKLRFLGAVAQIFPQFQGARPEHGRVAVELASFDQRHVTMDCGLWTVHTSKQTNGKEVTIHNTN